MALILKQMYKMYFYLDNDISDPRTNNRFLSTPLFLFGFLASYVFIVKKMGPRLMENRKPFNIRNYIIVYNIVQILINIRLFYLCFIGIQESPYILCVQNPFKDRVLFIRTFFFGLKFFDCIETVFFVLKKSYRQVSFLHVYHHCGMMFAGWIAHKYDVGDGGAFVGLINSFVHVFMFVYYLLSTLDPKWKNNLTIKKSLTMLQLIQFLTFICIYTALCLIPDCNAINQLVAQLFVIQNAFMLVLFGDFFIKTYLKKNKPKMS